MKLTIIDGYVDEPTCLGVPPYISTYIRYTAGAAVCAGIKKIDYITIDNLRNNDYILNNADYAVIITGNPVPGKYLGGLPLQGFELKKIALSNPEITIFVGGPVQFNEPKERNLKIIKYDIESFIFNYFYENKSKERYRTIDELNRFAVEGAFIVRKHPRFPDIIAEIETGRGCPRKEHCSFCIEGRFNVEFRRPEDVVEEIKALSNAGIRHFRLGKQADFYAYGTKMDEWRKGFPKPNLEWIKRLYEGIRGGVTDIATLHLDNVNPGTIANFQEESFKITEIIVKNNTAGDVAALGMESADPVVIEKNCLKANPAEVKKAIEIINSIGGFKVNGIPKFLPGINLIRGLKGENRNTFKLNYEFLKDILDNNLLLRRINIRQLRLSKDSLINDNYKVSQKEEKKLDAVFRNYREKIRKEIDSPMMAKIFSTGLILQDLIIEAHRGDWSIARGLGSYPIAVNIPGKIPILSKISAFIINNRERSLVGLNYPFILKNASYLELKQIPGLGKKAGELLSSGNINKNMLSISPIFDKIKDCIL